MTYHNKNQLIQIICLNIKLPFHRTLALQEFLSLFPPWRHRSCCIQDIRNIFGQQTPSFHWPEVSFPNVCQEVSYNALREYLVEKTNTTNHNLFDIFLRMVENYISSIFTYQLWSKSRKLPLSLRYKKYHWLCRNPW